MTFDYNIICGLQMKELADTTGWGEEKGSPLPDVNKAMACRWLCGGNLAGVVFSFVEYSFSDRRHLDPK